MSDKEGGRNPLEVATIDGLVEKGWVSESTAARAVAHLRELRRRVRGVPMPNVAPGPEGLIAFTWRTTDHYLTLELCGDGRIEAFHENLRTGELWSDEGHAISDRFVDRLRCHVVDV